jgi:hypothetical protein
MAQPTPSPTLGVDGLGFGFYFHSVAVASALFFKLLYLMTYPLLKGWDAGGLLIRVAA